jgi:hypothetical protein
MQPACRVVELADRRSLKEEGFSGGVGLLRCNCSLQLCRFPVLLGGDLQALPQGRL